MVISTLNLRVLIPKTMMNERKKRLFSSLFKEYTKTAQPVGSRWLVDKYDLGCSTATVRNEMMVLEQDGYLRQPHTSAGRTPTEKGYRYYLANFLEAKKITAKEQELFQQVVKKYQSEADNLLKSLAKLVAEISQRAVFLSLAPRVTYYTGIANLFSQVEFQNYKLIRNVSDIIDHLDEVLTELQENKVKETKILLGRENPFGGECASIFCSYKFKQCQGIFGVLSPWRLDYDRTLGLVDYTREVIGRL